MSFINVVRAVYDYDAKDSDELSIQEGEVLCVLGQDDGNEWMRACLLKDQSRVGLVPINYVSTVSQILLTA